MGQPTHILTEEPTQEAADEPPIRNYSPSRNPPHNQDLEKGHSPVEPVFPATNAVAHDAKDAVPADKERASSAAAAAAGTSVSDARRPGHDIDPREKIRQRWEGLGGRLPLVRSQTLPGHSSSAIGSSSRVHEGANSRSRDASMQRTPIPGPVPALFTKALLEPQKKLGTPPTYKRQLVNIARHSWLNVLLIMVPISWAMEFSHQSSTVIFCTAISAVIPLAGLLSFATEELAMRVGETFGGLLNATFGNAVELIVAILALTKGELQIVQSAMLGSILSNCLLVLGMCFFAGGLRFHEQGYGVRAAQLNITLLGISVVAIAIPAAFAASTNVVYNPDAGADPRILSISRGIAVILLTIYIGALLFQLWTHAYLYLPMPTPEPADEDLEGSDGAGRRSSIVAAPDGPQPTGSTVFRLPSWGSSSSASSVHSKDSDDDEEQPKLTVIGGLALLVFTTIITGVTAEFLISSISGLTATGGVSTEFVALILLPLVGNAVEHVTAVTVATKGKLDLSMAVAVGSSIQVSLFIIPFLVILAWCIGQPLTMFFDTFQTIILFLSVVLVNFAIQDGRTNWLEGLILMWLSPIPLDIPALERRPSKAAMTTPSEVPFEELKTSFFRLRVAVDTLKGTSIGYLSILSLNRIILRVEEAVARLHEDGALLLGLRLRKVDTEAIYRAVDVLLAMLSITRSIMHLYEGSALPVIREEVLIRQRDAVRRVHGSLHIVKGIVRHLIKRWPRRAAPSRGLNALSRKQMEMLQALVARHLACMRRIEPIEAGAAGAAVSLSAVSREAECVLHDAAKFLLTPGMEFHPTGFDIYIRATWADATLKCRMTTPQAVGLYQTYQDRMEYFKLLAHLRRPTCDPPHHDDLEVAIAEMLVALAGESLREFRPLDDLARDSIKRLRCHLASNTLDYPSQEAVRRADEARLNLDFAATVFTPRSRTLVAHFLAIGLLFIENRVLAQRFTEEGISLINEAIALPKPSPSDGQYGVTVQYLCAAHRLMALRYEEKQMYAKAKTLGKRALSLAEESHRVGQSVKTLEELQVCKELFLMA